MCRDELQLGFQLLGAGHGLFQELGPPTRALDGWENAERAKEDACVHGYYKRHSHVFQFACAAYSQAWRRSC